VLYSAIELPCASWPGWCRRRLRAEDFDHADDRAEGGEQGRMLADGPSEVRKRSSSWYGAAGIPRSTSFMISRELWAFSRVAKIRPIGEPSAVA